MVMDSLRPVIHRVDFHDQVDQIVIFVQFLPAAASASVRRNACIVHVSLEARVRDHGLQLAVLVITRAYLLRDLVGHGRLVAKTALLLVARGRRATTIMVVTASVLHAPSLAHKLKVCSRSAAGSPSGSCRTAS